MIESKIQAECYQWFNNNFCLEYHENRCMMFSIPNELGKSNALSTVMAKSIGLTAGVADSILIMPNKLFFVEFKTDVGKQSKKQFDFQNRVENLGFDYFIVRSITEFKTLIFDLGIKYLNKKPFHEHA